MKLIINITALLGLLVGFQSGMAMKMNPAFMASRDRSQPIALTRPTLSADDDRLWQLVFKACRADTNEQAMGIALNCLKILVEKGANLNAGYTIEFDEATSVRFGMPTAFYTPLVFAISSKKLDLVKRLIELGAGVNVTSTMGSPLHAAVTTGNIQVIPLLKEHGADINKQDEWGQTPLFSVLYNQNKKAFDLLYQFDDLDCTIQDNQGQTPLHFVILRNSPSKEIVKKLLARGASPHVLDRLGHSALDYARDGNYHDIVAILEGREVVNQDGFLANTIVSQSAQAQKITRTQAVLKAKLSKKKTKNSQPKASVHKKRTESEVEIETISPTKKLREALDALDLGKAGCNQPQHAVAGSVTPTRRKLVLSDEADTHEVDHSLQISVDRLARRVIDWQDDVFLAKQRELSHSPQEFARSVYYHQIPIEVIQCVIKHGTQNPYASKKFPQDVGIKYYLRGDMVFENAYDNPWARGRGQQPGYYHCTMNSAGLIYHVGFDPIQNGTSQLSAHTMPAALQLRTIQLPGFTRGIKHQFIM